MNNTSCHHTSLIKAIWLASFMLIMTVIIALAQSIGLIQSHSTIRVIGVMYGLILISTANYFPKQLCHHSTARAKRWIAWLFVIAGLLYIIVWLTGDTQRTKPLFSLMFAPACILSMLMYRYSMLKHTCIPTVEIQS